MSGLPVAVPPHAIDAEQALLGAVLQNPDAIDRAREHVQPGDFSDDVNRHIFEVMCQRRDAGEAIDLMLMKAVLGNADLGGISVGQYVVRLMHDATTVSGAPGYARLIAEAARMRIVLDVAHAGVGAMTTGSIHDPAAYAAHMIENLDAVAAAGLGANVRRVTLKESASSVMKRVEQVRLGRTARGVTFGLPSLDRATLGMRGGQLVILAGRPAMGKTATAVHIGVSAARSAGPVALFSLEMDAGELSERVLSAIAYDSRESEEITYRSIADGLVLSERSMGRLKEAERRCGHIPLWIEQEAGLSVAQIAARARQMRLKAEREGVPLSAIIIDHIGLVRASKRYAGNRVQEMTEISGALKGLAKEMGIPVLALSQLNRTVEGRADKRPMLSDLRESGSIEQDADMVIGLYREAYYLQHKASLTDPEVDNLERLKNVLEIEILKQRSGPTPRIEVFCNIGCNVLADRAG